MTASPHQRKTPMTDTFYIVQHEPGFEPEPLPVWSDREGQVNPFEDRDLSGIRRVDIPEVPGAFQMLDILSSTEADRFVAIAESLGFHEDAPVSLPHSVRHNQNLNWVVSEAIDGVFWERSRHLLTKRVNGEQVRGINARFRFYRYGVGDFFKPHSDGAWPSSQVVDGQLVADAHPGLLSQYSYLIFLSDGYEGGRTEFLVSRSDPTRPAARQDDVETVQVRTPKGAVLCFPHGHHPLHCVHSSEPIQSGLKYIIRTDILYG